MGKIVTFYSYKGGTGRSMALSNVAWILASNGYRVLMVDWDLEAPGLHRYLRPFLTDKELTGPESAGIIDFVVDFSIKVATPQREPTALQAGWYEEYADLSKWSKPLLWPSGELALMGRGRIDFVPAGRQGPQYGPKVNSFDWANFYERLNGGALFDAVRRRLISPYQSYDWVLIDSRTGVSDTAGICTLQLPDILVVCFTLNYQSISGAAAVASSVKKGRPEITIWPVAMRIDGSEEKLLNRMKAYAVEIFSPLLDLDVFQSEYWYQMEVPYFARYAYSEKLAPFEDQTGIYTSTLPAMERLAGYITDRYGMKLGKIPEEQRKAALAEFEAGPSTTQTVWVPQIRRWYSFLSRAFASIGYQLRQLLTWQTLLSLAVAFAVIFILQKQIDSIVSRFQQNKIIDALLAGAEKDIHSGVPDDREQGALLIAEAATRVHKGPDQSLDLKDKNVARLLDLLHSLAPLRSGEIKHTGPVHIARFSTDGVFVVSASSDRTARAFRTDGSKALDWVEPDSGWAVAFSPDGKYLACGGAFGTATLYDVNSLRVLQGLTLPGSIHNVAFSPDGKLIAAGANDVVVYAVSPWHQIAKIPRDAAVLDLAFSPDSRYLGIAGMDPTVLLYDLDPHAVGSSDYRINHFGPVRRVAFASQKNPLRVATASTDGTVNIWTLGRPLSTATLNIGADVYSVAFSPQGDLLATGSLDGTARLWSVPDGKELKVFNFQADVRDLAFSSDGKWLATGSGDYTARIFEVATGKELQHITFEREINSVAFSPDSKYLATASSDGSAATWLILLATGTQPSFTASDLVSVACRQASRILTIAEWKQFFGSERYNPACKSAAVALP